ncbi:unnamed protein product [Ophioblennius macclurei]
MKSVLVLILFSEVCVSRGQQQQVEESQQILLTLPFPPVYNHHHKSCCKLYPGGCYKLLDSAGFTCDLLRGRVSSAHRDGLVEFRISDVRFSDGGYYRCAVIGTQSHIYRDFYVEVLEASHHHIHPEPPSSSTAATPAITDLTGPAMAQDRGENGDAGTPWSVALPLVAIIASVAVTTSLVAAAVVGVVCYRVTSKRRPDDGGEILRDSEKREAPDGGGGGVVYTTVDFFKPHKKQDEIYANLRGGGGAREEHDDGGGAVEYSTLAIRR